MPAIHCVHKLSFHTGFRLAWHIALRTLLATGPQAFSGERSHHPSAIITLASATKAARTWTLFLQTSGFVAHCLSSQNPDRLTPNTQQIAAS